jgi:hypothetical protein
MEILSPDMLWLTERGFCNKDNFGPKEVGRHLLLKQ